MSDTGLLSVFDAMAVTENGVSAPVPETWRQGRTAYGGFSAALLLGTAQKLYPDLPPLRSALINFTGPLSEAPELTATILRQGRNVTTVDARAMVADQTAATGCFSFGQAQESGIEVK